MGVVAVGMVLTVLVTGIEFLAWGGAAILPGVTFGLLATGIQVIAVRQLKRGLNAPYADLMKRFAIGMGLRMAGILLFVIAVLIDRTLFPPLPAAFGYLGVVVPLLLAEKKLAT